MGTSISFDLQSAIIMHFHPTCQPNARTWRRSSLTRLSASKCWSTTTFAAILIPNTADMMKRSQRYSHYLPLYQSLSRTTSRAASFSKDGGSKSPRASKSGRPSSSLQSAKRRSTMNSRDAAYDEEEQLRRAIEASKGEKSGESTDGGGTRRGKRGRSDSEEYDNPILQRTLVLK